MNFFKYLESRFVTSQLAINRKQTTGGHAENHAVLALMYVSLKIATAFQILLILGHYLLVALHILPKLRAAKDIVTEARLEEKFKAETNEKVAAQVAKGALGVV